MDARQMRGLEIAERARIKQTERGWSVPSQSGGGYYEVYPRDGKTICTCPDCEVRGVKCKHQWAVEYYVKKTTDKQGNTTITQSMKITYTQDWTAYNNAQTNEIRLFDILLKDLMESVEEPEQVMGRPRLSMKENLFCAIQKVYSQLSQRRAYTLYKNAESREQIDHTPHFNAVGKLLNREDITPILKKLLSITALPLKGVESCFAPDSSGFRTSQFDEYYGYKFRKERIHRWLKAHILVGTKTNVIASAEITDGNASDCPQFLPLVNTAHESGFEIKEIPADKGYLSRDNYDLADSIGAVAYIPFKSNALQKSKGSKVWYKMFHYFQLNKDDFLQHYHQRSNVETAFMMIKSKFGDKLKSKNHIAQVNELLCKLIAHNIVVLIHEMHELKISPEFLHLNSNACT